MVKMVPAQGNDVVIEWTFVPEANQPSILDPFKGGSKKWKVSAAGDALFYNSTYPAGTGFAHAGATTVNDTVAKLNKETGEIIYAHPLHLADGATIPDDPDYISKALLNMFKPDAKEVSEMLYCKVSLAAYSVDAATNCRIKLGEEIINVRFLRPLTVALADGAKLKDAVPQGDDFLLGELISAYDWNAVKYSTGFPIFKAVKDAQGNVIDFESCYYPEGTQNVEWYGYYGFKNLAVSIDDVYTDQLLTEEEIAAIDAAKLNFSQVKAKYPKFGLLKVMKDDPANPGQKIVDNDLSINGAARIWVADKNDRLTEIDPTAIQIQQVSDLAKYIFVYANNKGVVHDFHLWVPVTIEYSWGYYTDYIKVPVQATQIVQN